MFNIKNSAIKLSPKSSYEEWLFSEEIFAKMSEDARAELQQMNLEGLRANATIITTPAIKQDIDIELNNFLTTHADKILVAELDRRGLEFSAKPSQTSLSLLQEWFDISYHRFLFGLVDNQK